MTPERGLSRLLTELRALAPPDDGPVIDEPSRRLAEQVLRHMDAAVRAEAEDVLDRARTLAGELDAACREGTRAGQEGGPWVSRARTGAGQ